MSASSIQAKIKNGLAKVALKTGSSNSDIVYLVRKTQGGSPVNPVTPANDEQPLKNAIFSSYDKSLVDSNILAGDIKIVSDSDVMVKQGDIIKRGSERFLIISVDDKAPMGESLAYISQARKQ